MKGEMVEKTLTTHLATGTLKEVFIVNSRCVTVSAVVFRALTSSLILPISANLNRKRVSD